MSEIRKPKKTSIGGQALMEGLLMMGPHKVSTCLRLANGEILEKTFDRPKASKASKIPFVRGVVNLFTQMKIGVGELMYSASQIDISEEDDKAKADKVESATESAETVAAELKSAADGAVEAAVGSVADEASVAAETVDAAAESAEVAAETVESATPAAEAPAAAAEDKDKETIPAWLLVITVVVSLALSVGMFILLPNLIVSFIPWDRSVTWIHILSNLIEGIVRIGIFVGYLSLVNQMKDMKRVWMYHGAEHKTIYCYESGMPLTVENCRSFPKEHKRCGTSFLFLVMIISILVFSLVPSINRWANLLVRLALIPVVAGISYEVIKYAGAHDTKFCNALSKPGLLFQKLTTREPDDSMLEVAIRAMENVIPENSEDDNW